MSETETTGGPTTATTVAPEKPAPLKRMHGAGDRLTLKGGMPATIVKRLGGNDLMVKPADGRQQVVDANRDITTNHSADEREAKHREACAAYEAHVKADAKTDADDNSSSAPTSPPASTPSGDKSAAAAAGAPPSSTSSPRPGAKTK